MEDRIIHILPGNGSSKGSESHHPEASSGPVEKGAGGEEKNIADADRILDENATEAVPVSVDKVTSTKGIEGIRVEDAVCRCFPEEENFAINQVYDTLVDDRPRMPRTTHWSIVWSDLMMTMFILFAVMYMYHSAHREFLGGEDLGSDIGTGLGTGVMGEKGGGGFEAEEGPIEDSLAKIFDLSRQKIDEQDLQEFANVDLAPDQTVRIILTGDLLFDTGKAEIKPRAKKSLSKIAEILRTTPYMVNVVGHTDNVPIHTREFPTNWELSVVRASVVARFLIEEMGLPGNRFYVTGHSYYQPVRSNDNIANRAANRRVEIVITRDMPSAVAAGDRSINLYR